MAPLALYRTYRPGTLAEVIGQDHVTGPLGRALTSGRIHHAYLFSGPRGCGKTSTARILARSLNCETGPTATPCGLCQSCVDLAPNGPGSLDVVELDAATHRGIDDAKELRERAIYAPVHSQFRIYILDEAHQLTPEAANALLKLIEEPPAHLRFIFATTEPDRIIPTIRSRTFHYGFRLVPARVLVPHMARVCEQEGIPADPTALSAIARAGGGSVRDSLSLLGQLLAGAGPEGLTQADAVAALGLTDGAVVDDFVAAVAGGSAATMFAIVDRVVSAGHDPRRFAGDVLDRIRDLIVVKAVPDAVDSGLVDVAPGEAERLMSQAQSLGQAQLSQVAGQLSAGLSELKGATAPRLQLELLCARLALPASGSDPAALAARVEVLERHWAQRGLPEASAAARGSRGPGAGSSALAASAPATAGEPVAAGTSGSNAQPDRSSPRTGASSQAGGATGGRTQAAAAGDAVAMPAAPVLRSGRGRSTAPADPVPASPAADSLAGPGDVLGPVTASTELTQVREGWIAILERLATSSRVAWTLFHQAVPLSVDEAILCLAVPQPGNVMAIMTKGHDERLRQVVIDVVGLDLRVSVVHDPGATAAAGGRAASGSGTPGPHLRTAGAADTGSGSAGRGTGQDEDARGSQQSGAGDARTPAPGASHDEAPRDGGGSRSGSRGAAVVREARNSRPAEMPDEASPDDPDLPSGDPDGLALITRELGARPIGEIDHS